MSLALKMNALVRTNVVEGANSFADLIDCCSPSSKLEDEVIFSAVKATVRSVKVALEHSLMGLAGTPPEYETQRLNAIPDATQKEAAIVLLRWARGQLGRVLNVLASLCAHQEGTLQIAAVRGFADVMNMLAQASINAGGKPSLPEGPLEEVRTFFLSGWFHAVQVS